MTEHRTAEISSSSPAHEKPSPEGRHRWSELLFVHWEVPAADIQRNLPPGLVVDTWEGKAYLGLVPFTMPLVKPYRWLPPIPGARAFHETNVRTYVRFPGSEPGVWFFSLDAASSLAVLGARWFWSLPYFCAEMSLGKEGQCIAYQSKRLWPRSPDAEGSGEGPSASPHATLSISYRIGERIGIAQPNTLEHFLVERYYLYTYRKGVLYKGRVRHSPYPLASAEILAMQQTMTDAAGFHALGPQTLSLYSPGVEVDVYPLEQVIPLAGSNVKIEG